MSEPDITNLRAAIDEIDNRLISLLNERSEIVKHVGMTKKKRQQDGQAFIRSGREASMLRRIFKAFETGSFPAHGAIQIWRMIICASLSLEAPLTITAFAPEPNHEIYWLAREYFGYFTPVSRQPTAKRVLGDILDGKAEVGVLPLPDESFNNAHDGSWWRELPEGIKIFACVPFILQNGASIKALAVARLQPENTGDDISFIKLQTDMNVSQSRLSSVFEKNKLEARWVYIDTTPSKERTHLIEIKGFIAEDAAALKAIKADIGSSLNAITLLGSYAVPIITQKEKA
jgi:chorismate mutase